MKCHACQTTPRDWDGDDRRCAFAKGAYGDNWNCATVNRLRDLVYEGQKLPSWIDYQYCSDRKYATVNLDDFSECTDTESLRPVLALWVTWYKSRGATDALWLLFPDEPPRAPTEAELVEICVYLEKRRGKP